MSGSSSQNDAAGAKPDFTGGFSVERIPDGGMVEGNAGGEDVILARRGDEFFAVGAFCTHYHGPLAEGLLRGDELRCPLHHACFSIRTGEALRAPAFEPIPCWRVERIGDSVFVREKLPSQKRALDPARKVPASVVIVGGGAAGFAAAEMLRRQGYDRPVTMISADDSAPYDRPNVSKDYLAGTAPEEFMPLQPADYYADRHIDLVLNSRVSRIDVAKKQVHVEGGRAYDFDALLLATGADPVKLSIPGASASQLHYVRTYADGRALIEKAASAKQALIVGASFIGLEVAASLRERNIAVHVVAPDRQPFEATLGPEIGRFMRELHESHGVVFHPGETLARLDGEKATLSSGSTLDADIVVLGVGVSPSVGLAEQAGLKLDRGVLVNEYLETSAPGIYAAGDIARWPDAASGKPIRIEHWMVAVPFFWTQQYDVAIKYVGHAEKWDTIDIDGSLEARDCALAYKLNGRTVAVATISRDLESLRIEASMEASIQDREN